jgi:hypothetical protein
VQLQRDSLLYGSVPDSETCSLLYCWRRYNFREAQFVVFVFVGAATETRGCVVDIYSRGQAVVLFAYVQPQKQVVVTYLQPQRHEFSCSSFKKIALRLEPSKRKDCDLFTQLLQDFTRFGRCNMIYACRIYRVRHAEDCFSDFTIRGGYSTDVTSKFIPGMTR